MAAFMMTLMQRLSCRLRLKYCVVLLLVVALITGIIYYGYLKSTTSVAHYSAEQDFAEELRTILQELQVAQRNQLPPSNTSLRGLRRILTQINPGYSVKNLTLTPPVCPEQFTDIYYGMPYYENEKGWITQPCDAPPIEEVVSIVLNPLDSADCSVHLDWILKGIKKTYPSVITYAATKPECEAVQAKNYSNVRQVSFSSKESAGNIWMKLLSKVTTPYVLIARNLFHFTNFSRLERQISIVTDELIPVAGGASRNLTGHWSVGCYQTKMSNYILKYVEGYHVSRKESMFCDYLAGPFVARMEIFREIPLHTSLNEDELFHDFFLQLKTSNYLAANCPDAMYFANSQQMDHLKKSWIQLARKWQLNRILLPSGVKHVITCHESKLSCQRTISKEGYLIPICCRKEYLRYLKMVLDTDIRYELHSGDALAAAKMRGSIPWDYDTDLTIKISDKDLWNQTQKQIRLRIVGVDDWFQAQSPYTTICMDPIKELSYAVLLPEELKHLPTLVEYDGEWLVGPASPGLYARNAYGVEMLKHVQKGSSNPGSFIPCIDPQHHACLNHFSTDGNIQFMVP